MSRWQRAVSGKSMITKEAGGYVAEITIDMIPRGSFYNNLRFKGLEGGIDGILMSLGAVST